MIATQNNSYSSYAIQKTHPEREEMCAPIDSFTIIQRTRKYLARIRIVQDKTHRGVSVLRVIV